MESQNLTVAPIEELCQKSRSFFKKKFNSKVTDLSSSDAGKKSECFVLKNDGETAQNDLTTCCHATRTESVISKRSSTETQFSSISATERICRICLDSVGEGKLIAPCRCSGSTKYAHEKCLLQWFYRSSKNSCEVCLGTVNVTAVGYKPVQQWRLPERSCDFILYLFGLYFVIMILFAGMITWVASQGCGSPVCITLYVLCAIAFIYFFYCCGCVDYSRQYWISLLSVNRIWRIYGREDSIKHDKKTKKKKDKTELTIAPPYLISNDATSATTSNYLQNIDYSRSQSC